MATEPTMTAGRGASTNQVRLDHAPVQRHGNLVEQPDHADAHVVDPDVDATERLDGGLRERRHRVRVRHVGGHDQDRGATRFAFGGDDVQRASVPRRQHEPAAAFGERMRGRAPDAAGGPGQDDDGAGWGMELHASSRLASRTRGKRGSRMPGSEMTWSNASARQQAAIRRIGPTACYRCIRQVIATAVVIQG
jgi:hypothetical protein